MVSGFLCSFSFLFEVIAFGSRVGTLSTSALPTSAHRVMRVKQQPQKNPHSRPLETHETCSTPVTKANFDYRVPYTTVFIQVLTSSILNKYVVI